MDGYERFDSFGTYSKVAVAYAEWCENEAFLKAEECCWRTGQQIADAIDEMLLT
jgi:hypothetical protein